MSCGTIGTLLFKSIHALLAANAPDCGTVTSRTSHRRKEREKEASAKEKEGTEDGVDEERERGRRRGKQQEAAFSLSPSALGFARVLSLAGARDRRAAERLAWVVA